MTATRSDISLGFFEHVVRVVRVMRWRAGLVLALIACTGLLESFGLLLLIPLLGAIGLDVQQGPVGRISALVSAVFAGVRLTPTLPLVLGVFVAVNVALAMLRRAQGILAASLEQDVVRATTQRLYGAIVHMNWLAFSRLRGSDLTVALTFDCERVGLASSQLLTIAASLMVTLVYVLLAFRLSFFISAAVFACGTALLVILRRRTDRAALLGANYADAVRDVQGAVTDDLAGMKTIRSFVAERRSHLRFTTLTDGIAAIRFASIRNVLDSNFWVEVGSVAMLSLLVLVAIRGLNFTAPALLMLLFLFARIVPRFAWLQQNLHFYVSLLPSIHRVADLEARCLAAAEPSFELMPALRPHHHIRFESVTFRYDAEGPPVLADVDLTINAGAMVAIVGSSGAGKTTVVDLMMGLLSPERGRILVDDVALDANSIGPWRQAIAYVPQDTFLFHDTIRANLQWAVPTATDDAIKDALVLASADFVFELRQGLDTIVGDRGVRLSGGERQRIALARALLRHPWLLILDEATSALDSENERRIFDAIERLHGSMTIVMITHRVSAVAGADLIYVLEKGRLVESGSWDVLMMMPAGRFRALCEAQGMIVTPALPR
jgi:ATP-binding cassette, subfamily C, bacterial